MKQNYQRKNWLFLILPQKNEDFAYCEYVEHLEKFGYQWEKEGFKYEIKIKDNKMIKKNSL